VILTLRNSQRCVEADGTELRRSLFHQCAIKQAGVAEVLGEGQGALVHLGNARISLHETQDRREGEVEVEGLED